MDFKKLLAKIVNLLFKYFLSNYLVECGSGDALSICFSTEQTAFP